MRRRIEAARRDPLTGLMGRAAFEHRAARLLRRGPAVVVCLDLDRFKQLNDRFGHAAGDAALRGTAASLNDILEGCPGSIAARLGGDEFAAVVPATDAAAVPWLLGGLHDEITAPLWHDGRSLTVGASIGAALTVDQPLPDLSCALRRADEAMYAAKRAGGGWRVATEAVPVLPSVNGRRAGRPGTHTTTPEGSPA
ncbi:GGDEF domain-containing protein [Streptomyces sp. ICBB 8177]|nr:GGDEF domain-containing protein [Streptomyces sp. ICBB 8177]